MSEAVWISHEQVVSRLRVAGYKFHRQADRVEFYKKKGSTKRVVVGRRDRFTSNQATLILGQAGLTRADVAEFLQHCVK